MTSEPKNKIPFPDDAPQRAERLYTEGAVDDAVAQHFGVSRQILYLWRSRDAAFDEACARGKQAGEAIRSAAISEALKGEQPENWKVPPENTSDTVNKLCAMGHTDFEIAAFFGVNTKTLTNWKQRYPEVAQAFKSGKDVADERVERSLYSRATGYSFDAIKIFNDKGSVTKVPYVEHAPPDTVACIFWLKNRRAEMWRDRREVVATGDGKNLNDLTNDELDRQVVEALRRATELTRQVGDLAGTQGPAPARPAKPDRVH